MKNWILMIQFEPPSLKGKNSTRMQALGNKTTFRYACAIAPVSRDIFVLSIAQRTLDLDDDFQRPAA
jgi:hypothetical protein